MSIRICWNNWLAKRLLIYLSDLILLNRKGVLGFGEVGLFEISFRWAISKMNFSVCFKIILTATIG